MSVALTWFGHATWMIQVDGQKILLDPFFEDNPATDVRAQDVQCDLILVSHGHADHMADAATIAKRTSAPIVAIFEIAQWFSAQGIQHTVGMNIGGTCVHESLRIKMTPALHSSALPDGSNGGCPAGFVISASGARLYFACDTGLFSDMKLIGANGLDAAILPIGDLFTMGPEDSTVATSWLEPRYVLPSHYNTWPPIEQDANAWASMIKQSTSATAVILQPGEKFTLPPSN
jgi:L-ascorbate metabolism protein UlaG (beta-lactamase superfamily)